MTRDAEHTPFPQSVVVPVEPTEAMMKAADAVDWSNEDERASAINMWQSMLAAAPAPSSVAGGEVTNDDAPTYMRLAQALSRHPEVMVVERSDPSLELTPGSLEHLLEDVFPLAALSPEAPAREGVEPWKEGREEGRLAARPWRKGDPVPAVGTMVLVSGAHGDIESDQHRAFQWRRVIGYGVDGADFICLQNKGCWPTVERMENCWFAAITPRHEAPAEGAGERLIRAARSSIRVNGTDREMEAACVELEEALRARSSAPEAREGAAVWRCFHCDEAFTDRRCAAAHFGADETAAPACQIKGSEGGLVEALRRAEKDAGDAWFAIHNESTEAAQAYYAQNSRHREQMIAVEQAGYDRGLADAKAHPETLGLTAAPSADQ